MKALEICTFMYHETVENPISKYSVSVLNTLNQVKEILTTYDIVTFEDLDVLISNNKFHEKQNKVIITFDDGHISNYEVAKKLNELGVRAVFYVVKDFSLNNKEYITEKQIINISQMGHEIGIHGKDHNWWTLKSKNQLLAELLETKIWIEKLTSKEVVSCSAPGGKVTNLITKFIHKNIPSISYVRSIKPIRRFKYKKSSVGTYYVHTNTTANEIIDLIKNNWKSIINRKLEYTIKFIFKFLFNK